jgi:hypothetical protein
MQFLDQESDLSRHDPGDPQPQGRPTLVSPWEAGLSRALDPTMYAGEERRSGW